MKNNTQITAIWKCHIDQARRKRLLEGIEGFSHYSLVQGGRGLGQIPLRVADLVASLSDSGSQANPKSCLQILGEKKNKDNVRTSARRPVVQS